MFVMGEVVQIHITDVKQNGELDSRYKGSQKKTDQTIWEKPKWFFFPAFDD